MNLPGRRAAPVTTDVYHADLTGHARPRSGETRMSVAPKILIQKMWDVTIVDFQEARLLEADQIDAIGKQLYRLVDEMHIQKLILDFAKVQFLASAAIGVLMNLHKKSNAIKGTFVICSLRKELMKVFEIMKLTKVFKFAANEDEALALLGYTAAG
jgi:anti-anti-sigma factor